MYVVGNFSSGYLGTKTWTIAYVDVNQFLFIDFTPWVTVNDLMNAWDVY